MAVTYVDRQVCCYFHGMVQCYRLMLHIYVTIFPASITNDSIEEADHIETNGAVSMCSAAIFSPHVLAENRQLVRIKSQWRV